MADAKEEKLERAKMDWAKLSDTIKRGLRFDKKGVSLNCPGIGLIPTTRTNTKVPLFMAGLTPERCVTYKDKVQTLKSFYSLRVFDESGNLVQEQVMENQTQYDGLDVISHDCVDEFQSDDDDNFKVVGRKEFGKKKGKKNGK